MSAETKTRVLITGFDLEVQAAFRGSYRAMMTELLISDEFADPGKWAGEIYLDLAKSEDDHPEQGALLARWEAVVEVRRGEKVVSELTIRGLDGVELQ